MYTNGVQKQNGRRMRSETGVSWTEKNCTFQMGSEEYDPFIRTLFSFTFSPFRLFPNL
jgi:hypothetical protein